MQKSKYIIIINYIILGLLLFSRDDVVSNVQTNYLVAEMWKRNNILARVKCWDKSTHVLHYKENPAEYEYEVDMFLAQVDEITKAPKRIISSSLSTHNAADVTITN